MVVTLFCWQQKLEKLFLGKKEPDDFFSSQIVDKEFWRGGGTLLRWSGLKGKNFFSLRFTLFALKIGPTHEVSRVYMEKILR